MTLKSVDLPQPDGPTIATKEPSSIVSDVGSSATVEPKDFAILSSCKSSFILTRQM